jgi:hypothetical protein
LGWGDDIRWALYLGLCTPPFGTSYLLVSSGCPAKLESSKLADENWPRYDIDVPYIQGVSRDMWDMSFMAALGMRSSR